MVIVGRKILNNEVKDDEAIRAAVAKELEENKSRCFNLPKIKPTAAKKDIHHHNNNNNNNRTTRSLDIQSGEILNSSIEGFNLTTIIDATRNFNAKRKIGDGGFGQVYKGVLRNGKVIAVKRLSASTGQGREEFLFEVNTISTVKHPNIIRLLGYCDEREELILVYEYMEKNSVSCALFGSQKKNLGLLNWEARVKICLGVAKGLAFLNEEHKIFHRDIKLSNVLLDQHLNPKICDFGLARRFEKKEGKESMEYRTRRVVGTYGYMAPEYLLGTVTEKIDVYSFGIVILELVSGKKNMIYGETHEQLLFLACALHGEGDLLSMVDEDLRMNISVNEANMMLDLAMRCTNRSPKVRPTMSEVVSILEGKSTVRTPPSHEPSELINDVPNESMIMTMPVSINYSSSNNTSVERSFIDNDHVPQLLGDSDDVCDLDDRGTDQVVSSPLRSRMEGNDTQISFEGAFICEVIKDCITDAIKDMKLLIHEKLMTSPGPSTSLIAKPWNPTIFVDATKMEKNHKLEYVQSSFEEGKFHIECSDEEFEVECNKWKDSLVGFFVNEPLPFNVEKETVEKLWELKGEVSILSMENGYFLFQFNCIEDKIMVLESSPWHIDEQPLVIREWDWKLKLDHTEMTTLPIWVKIYSLPLFLWSSSFLSKVGSCLGIPLYSDRKTENKQRFSFARLCVEVNARKELPESLNISVKGVDYKLNLKYEWKPLRCATCCTFGHTEAKCGLTQSKNEVYSNTEELDKSKRRCPRMAEHHGRIFSSRPVLLLPVERSKGGETKQNQMLQLTKNNVAAYRRLNLQLKENPPQQQQQVWGKFLGQFLVVEPGSGPLRAGRQFVVEWKTTQAAVKPQPISCQSKGVLEWLNIYYREIFSSSCGFLLFGES